MFTIQGEQVKVTLYIHYLKLPGLLQNFFFWYTEAFQMHPCLINLASKSPQRVCIIINVKITTFSFLKTNFCGRTFYKGKTNKWIQRAVVVVFSEATCSFFCSLIKY